MKKFALILLLGVLMIRNAYTQLSNDVIGKTFIVSTTLTATPIQYPANTTKAGFPNLALTRGLIFNVIGIAPDTSGYIIELWQFSETHYKELIADKEFKGRTDLLNNTVQYFRVSLTEFLKAIPYERGAFTFGTSLLPVKLRPGYGKMGEFEFSTDITLNATFGYKLKLSRFRPYYFVPTFSSGISVVRIDEKSTFGNVTESRDLAGFSMSLGAFFELDRIQVGFFVGSDLISQNSKYFWINQGRPWYSIGLGYRLFSGTEPGKAQQGTQSKNTSVNYAQNNLLQK